MACPYNYGDTNLSQYCASDNFLCWNVPISSGNGACPSPGVTIPTFVNGPLATTGGFPIVKAGDVCLSLYNGSYSNSTNLTPHYNPNRDGTSTDDQKMGNSPQDFVVFQGGPDPNTLGNYYYFSSPINVNACEGILPAPLLPRGGSESGLPSNDIDYAFFPQVTSNQVCNSYNQTCVVNYDRLFYSSSDLGSTSPSEAFTWNKAMSNRLYNQTFAAATWTDPLRPGADVRDRIMASYCPQLTVDPSQCPIPPLGGIRPSNCTNFSADPTCHTWSGDILTGYFASISTAPMPSDKLIVYNNAITRACQGRDPNEFPECSCENMTQTKQWQDIQTAASNIGVPFQPEAPQCWFVPCQGPYTSAGFYLTNTTQVIQPATCPSICNTIVSIRDNPNSNIDIGTISSYINCPGSPTPPGPSPPHPDNIWSKYKWWIIGGIIGFIILIVILLLLVR